MKKINFLWLVSILMLLPIGFVSCSDDDDEVGSDEIGSSANLVGVWKLVPDKTWVKENGEIIYDTDEGSSLVIEFKADGTWNMVGHYTGEYLVYEEDEGTWNYKNGVLTTSGIEDDGEIYSTRSTVKELTATKLVIEGYEEGIFEHVEYRKISD